MGLRKEAREILTEKERVAFGRWRHIGTRLHAKIGEMASSGNLVQFGEFLEEAPTYVSSIVRGVPGIGVRFAEAAHTALRVSSKEEMVRAARDGRLRQVRGFGATRTARIASLPLPGDAIQMAFAF